MDSFPSSLLFWLISLLAGTLAGFFSLIPRSHDQLYTLRTRYCSFFCSFFFCFYSFFFFVIRNSSNLVQGERKTKKKNKKKKIMLIDRAFLLLRLYFLSSIFILFVFYVADSIPPGTLVSIPMYLRE